jgi:muramidase (phage lysozyme)
MDSRTRALLDTISYAEGTWRGGSDEGYRVMFGGGLADPSKSGGRHPDRVVHGGRVSSAAAGRYQFMPDTWAAASKATGVGPDQFFNPAAQDKAAAYLASRRLGGVQLGDTLTPEVASRLAPEWASFPTASGSSYYPNQSVKKLGELDGFYRQRLAALGNGSGGTAPAAPASPSPGAGSTEIDWAKVLMGSEPEAVQPAQKRRFALTGLASPGLLESVDDGRMAGERIGGSGVDFSDPAQNPFLAAVGGGQKRAEDGQATASKAGDLFSSVLDNFKEETTATAGPGATKGLAGIADTAEEAFGMDTRKGPDGGNNACLYAVNKVLSQAGYVPPWGNSQYVPDARRALASGSGTLLAKPEPGAIAIMRDSHEKDPYPHIGIVGSDGRIISNSSSKGNFGWRDSAEGYAKYYGKAPEFWRLDN